MNALMPLTENSCIWVDEQLQPHEHFIGLYQLDKTNVDFYHRDVLIRLELSLLDVEGHVMMVQVQWGVPGME